MLLILYY